MGGKGGGGPSKEEVQAQIDMNAANMKAMERQQQAALQAAGMQAAAGVAQAQIAANAGIKASQNAALGGIVGAALGAHTTHEEIKQMLPSEAGAETIRSWELAQKWNKTIQMKTAGYQDVAIEYELSGKNYKPLFKDSQWNAMEMARLTKEDMVSNARTFGIQSSTNPGGIPLSKEDFIKMHSMKNPKEMLTVDPEVAKARQAEFARWEQDMRNKGMGLVVDIYKNPQLAGSSLLTMKGKDPLLDPALAPLVKEMVKPQPQPNIYMPNFSGSASAPGANPKIAEYEAYIKNRYVNKDTPFSDEGHMGNDELRRFQQEIEIMKQADATALADFNKTQGNYNSEMQKFQNSLNQQPQDTTDWDAVIDSLTKGDQNMYTDQINKLMEQGLIDKYGMVNGGVLMSMVPPSLQETPEFNPYRKLSEQEIVKLTSLYDQYSNMNIDPKLIKEQQIGFGVSRRIKLNPDNSIAAQAMEGYMTDMMGNPVWVSMQGQSLQEFYDRQSMISGMGPLFPGMLAPVTAADKNGSFEPGFWGQGQYEPNQQSINAKEREKSQSGQNAAQFKMPTYPSAPPAAPGMGGPGALPTLGPTGGSQKPASNVEMGSGGAEQSSMPAGYSGAPLAAGGE